MAESASNGCVSNQPWDPPKIAPGRIYFQVASSELLAAARSVEMMGVLLLRHSDDPLGATKNQRLMGASAKGHQQGNI